MDWTNHLLYHTINNFVMKIDFFSVTHLGVVGKRFCQIPWIFFLQIFTHFLKLKETRITCLSLLWMLFNLHFNSFFPQYTPIFFVIIGYHFTKLLWVPNLVNALCKYCDINHFIIWFIFLLFVCSFQFCIVVFRSIYFMFELAVKALRFVIKLNTVIWDEFF